VISFDEALRLVVELARPLGTEELSLGAAAGRVLAAPVVARLSSPRADASTMDGYAVREADLAALPARLRVVGESLPGAAAARALEPGSCLRIFTGAPVPDGADRVVIQEVVRREDQLAVIEAAPESDRFIRAAGSDFPEGEALLHAGERLGPRQLVAAAAADVADVAVYRRPRLAIIATGDELAPPGTARERPGAVPESASFGVAALARHRGADLIGADRLPDDLPLLEQACAQALEGADLLVVTGGASVGERDFGRQMFGDALDLAFSKVAIKPGKPVWLGRARGRLVVGLPGNPTSAMVTARLFLAPLLAGMSGLDPHRALQWRPVPLVEPAGATDGRETFARARLDGGAARLLSNQDSGAQHALAHADLLVRLPPRNPPLPAGAMVPALDF